MKNPCTKDCPRRKCGCAVDCPDWAEYVKARNAHYEERLAATQKSGKTYAYRKKVNEIVREN